MRALDAGITSPSTVSTGGSSKSPVGSIPIVRMDKIEGSRASSRDRVSGGSVDALLPLHSDAWNGYVHSWTTVPKILEVHHLKPIKFHVL